MQIVMTKRIINRGTCTVELEACPSSSAGALYQKCQQESMLTLPATMILSTKRGTSSMRVSQYPKVESKTSNWGFITSARGTTSRRL